MSYRGKLLRIKGFGVTNAELAFVRFRKWRSAFKDDYVIGHGSQSLAWVRCMRVAAPVVPLAGFSV